MKNKDLLLITGGVILLNEILKPADKIAIGEVKSEIDELIRYAITSNGNINKKAVIEKVSKDEATKLEKSIEEDLTGFKHTVDAYAIKHILKQHGNSEKEKLRGLIAETINDFFLLPAIIKNADLITISKTRLGLKAFIYKKKIGDIYYYIEEIRTGKKELSATTLYKKRPLNNDLLIS